MAETPYNHYALYEPDASPDLTASGEYNSAIMAIDSDMHSEEQARIEGDASLNVALANETASRTAADTRLQDLIDDEAHERHVEDTLIRSNYMADDDAIETAYKAADATEANTRKAEDGKLDARITELSNKEIADVRDANAKIAQEVKDRQAADTALGKRIDNAEVEISANSADLTGLKSLTYGDEHVNFIESSNGAYSSPALEEIDEQIKALQGIGFTIIAPTSDTLTTNELSILKQKWPLVAIRADNTLLMPSYYGQGGYTFAQIFANYSDDDNYEAPQTGTPTYKISGIYVKNSGKMTSHLRADFPTSGGITGTTQWGQIETAS